ncbi:BCCT family transporter [Streptococcus pneumoniae]
MKKSQLDWFITIVPLAVAIIISTVFFIAPKISNDVLQKVRFFFGDTLGVYYLVIGLGVFITTLWVAISKYGTIVLGNQDDKPKYSFFTWGSMMFTAGLAADILYYSFSEWILYALDPHLSELGNVNEWVGVFPIFHWGLIPWGFYLILAVAFGFMLHVKNINRQKFSEACRPILGKHIDGMVGRGIDLLAVFAILAGTATTFSLATPLMSSLINHVFKTNFDSKVLTIVILILTCCVYTLVLLNSFKGVSFLAKICIYCFVTLLLYILFIGGEFQFIVENGFLSLGKMFQHFFELSTYTDPQRTTYFPQKWTMFYWSYWMVWCVAAPFFIGSISKGRTIRQTIFGGYLFGAGSTILSFIILGNYSFGKQLSGVYDFIGSYQHKGTLYPVIIEMIESLPLSNWILLLLLITMIMFYATSFDSIAYIASCYSYRTLNDYQEPHKLVQLVWCILLIILPIALVFSESSMENLQSLSIISAFPIGIVIVLIIVGFIKDMRIFYRTIKRDLI